MSASDLRDALSLAVVALGSALPISCAPELPDPPDVSRLVASYAEPDGSVETSKPAAWLDAAEAQVDLLGGGNADSFVTGLVGRVNGLIGRASLPEGNDGAIRTRVDGIANVRMKCGATDDANADVQLEIVDGQIAPVLWGIAHRCALWETLGASEAYDGPFVMYRYPGNDMLVRVDGTIVSSRQRIRLDFRVASGRLETRVETPRGEVIATRSGQDDVIARAANGSFRCSRTLRTCRR
ncbi:MAG: hypothetical protein JWP87_5450 [Labilithrix sp.]|nr:hypothetical protein [Labilithrix sp.]